MFGLFESLAKAAVAVVATPVADVAQEAGIIEDDGKNHTGDMLSAVVENLEDAVKPNKW